MIRRRVEHVAVSAKDVLSREVLQLMTTQTAKHWNRLLNTDFRKMFGR